MFNKSFSKNATLNIIKTVCSVLFPLITFPYVSRVLGPEGYGRYSFSNSIVSYFLLAGMLGINTYGIREGARIRDKKIELQRFANDITALNLFAVFISYVALFVITAITPKIFDKRALIAILSLTLICNFLGRDWINTIFEDYFYITIRYIVIQLISLASIFILVHSPDDCAVYTGIITFSSSMGFIINLFYTKKYIAFEIRKPTEVKKHLIPILILFCGQLATMIYIQSDITMIGFVGTEIDVGVYSFASKIYMLTKSVINAITTVAIPRIVYYLGNNEEAKYSSFSSKLFELLFTLGIPAATGMFLLSDEILLLLGGSKYATGSNTLKILSVALIFAIFSGFFANAILIPNREERPFLYITIVAAIINIALNLVFLPQIGISGAAITTLISEAFVTMVAYCTGRKFLKLTLHLRNIISPIVGSLTIIITCCFVKTCLISSFVKLIVAVPVAVLLYVFILVLFKNTLIVEMYSSVRKIIRN